MNKLTKKQQKLVSDNIGLAYSIANQLYKRLDLDKADFRQEAALALCEAAKRYDHSRGFKFSTFAFIVIKRHIVDKVVCSNNPIFIPNIHSRRKIRCGGDASLFPEMVQVGEDDATYTIDDRLEIADLVSRIDATEQQILKLYVDGLSLQAIANELQIDVSIISNVFKSIVEQLKSIAQAEQGINGEQETKLP